jgi:hypothetical protein
VTYLAVSLFFTLALLAALVAAHMTVRLHWREILLALRGELGAATLPERSAARAGEMRRRAAF